MDYRDSALPAPTSERSGQWTHSYRDATVDVAVRTQTTGGDVLHVRVQCAGNSGPLVLELLFDALRHASSLTELSRRGFAAGYRVEDLISLALETPREADHDDTLRWVRRRVPKETSLRVEAVEAWTLRATFAPRGELPTSQRARYERRDGRIRVEAFELHVVEHCNLRCAHCCNMSPYLDPHELTPEEVLDQCGRMAEHLEVDVFKIMGGEPLLHPRIVEILEAIRASRISSTIRLFTNGLLLRKMGDDFWGALDQMTISSYRSAPVSEAILAQAREKARAFDVVLNIKPVEEFSEVMAAVRENDDQRVRQTYADCWLRHRCLVVRGGRFFKCTRAAYAAEFHETLLHGEYPEDRRRAVAGDGVTLAAQGFGEAILTYLNGEEPLASCRFCHGGAGPVSEHVQLRKSDVAHGQLRRLPMAGS